MIKPTRKIKAISLVLLDSFLIILANYISFIFMVPFVIINRDYLAITLISSVVCYLFYGGIFKVFTRINRYTNLNELLGIFAALTFMLFSIFLLFYLFNQELMYQISLRLVVFSYIMALLLIASSRLGWRVWVELKNKNGRSNEKKVRILIIGAGEGGQLLYQSFLGSQIVNNIEVVGFVDDDCNKWGTYLLGKKVLGNTREINQLIQTFRINMVTIAIPSLPKKKIQQLVQSIENKNIKVNMVPSFEEVATGKINVSQLKEVDVIDLLGREEVSLDLESISHQLEGQTILVTGAGGSIGSEICRQVLAFEPAKLILLGHGENSIYSIHRELTTLDPQRKVEILPIIADIQDRERIFYLMEKYHPTIVYHAAAHKHVPLMEYNPTEAIKNNINGTKNVAEAAKKNHVKNFVMISSDKANRPPNVMGATKRIAEMLITSLNQSGETKFSAVRFGNVLGSRGSVIPLFKEQILRGGPIIVTDFRMTRYFMTIPEASRLVIQSGALAKGGEIFVLDMDKPIKIVDLAKNMIHLSGYTEEDIEIVETGIRPGEKLYEELLLEKEKKETQIFEKIFVGDIKGFSLKEVTQLIEQLPEDESEAAKKVIAFANASNE
ncbi:nucleoside-diphosphate sugar epimerase/dehydratase [Enterococcus hirae]|uniref:polysaccharide biosynthesis protein n=1 Tax=Enterococcus hirae TaxID=1354 RepID=UPI001A09C11A|nr:nucleoside-diphosphate sugar epimerase/dehydratase [Enterococcus hirae]EMF0062735.1 polysaccharide biosynthesis protein [Enterococcus hirae]EMF0087704.1 polysaccharide biosynthesis protein [Enterococcus hirae]EMF0179540.1 polysaccharide biosynthesis protein [Enterococcus hirae]MDT2632527.1 nucleoside-diphosphate sugar epimerase/dehydratase [Enterococcus hirae]MDT2648972.1 nucleoside-diphosphate sugar epimerase/dehydratase [Enterococcus hirae]